MNPKQSWNIRWAARLILACGGLTLTIPGYAQSQGGTPQTSQNSDNEIILQSTGNGSFNLPDDMRIKNISSGRFDDSERWISAKAINLNGNKIEIEEASTIKIKLR